MFVFNFYSFRTLKVLASALRFIQKVASDSDDVEQYEEDATEAQQLTQLPANECSQALIDLCLSLNARKLRLCRTLVLFVMTKAHQLFKSEDVESAIKVRIRPSI